MLPFFSRWELKTIGCFLRVEFTLFELACTWNHSPRVHAPVQNLPPYSVPRWSLEHSLILLATAPRLTRLMLDIDFVPQSDASQWLQLVQHLKHLKHLTANGLAAAAGDALDSMLVVSVPIWIAGCSLYYLTAVLLASMWFTMGKRSLDTLFLVARVASIVPVPPMCAMRSQMDCRVLAGPEKQP